MALFVVVLSLAVICSASADPINVSADPIKLSTTTSATTENTLGTVHPNLPITITSTTTERVSGSERTIPLGPYESLGDLFSTKLNKTRPSSTTSTSLAPTTSSTTTTTTTTTTTVPPPPGYPLKLTNRIQPDTTSTTTERKSGSSYTTPATTTTTASTTTENSRGVTHSTKPKKSHYDNDAPTDADFPLSKMFRNDYTFLSSQNTFYKFHKIKKHFKAAFLQCMLEGAELYYPKSFTESEQVVALIPPTSDSKIWIGMHDLYSEGNFITLKGKPTAEVYSYWKVGKPSSAHRSDDCVTMSIMSTELGMFSDEYCRNETSFVCSRDMNNLRRNEHCSTYDKEYVYNQEINACYKVHNRAKTWSDALDTCLAEQSTLVIVGSQLEADVLVQMMKKKGADKSYVGFSNIMLSDTHLTLEGKLLSESGYYNLSSKWDDKNASYGCGLIESDGLLNVESCDKKRSFICRKPAAILPSNV